MPQEPKLLDRAKRMRHEATPFEINLWRHLSSSQIGHKFRRQHVIDAAIVDFFCPAKGLVVEVDGNTHDTAVDVKRDEGMAAKGYTTLRFTNAQIANDLESVLETIAATLLTTPGRWPHPNPSPKGEGL